MPHSAQGWPTSRLDEFHNKTASSAQKGRAPDAEAWEIDEASLPRRKVLWRNEPFAPRLAGPLAGFQNKGYAKKDLARGLVRRTMAQRALLPGGIFPCKTHCANKPEYELSHTWQPLAALAAKRLPIGVTAIFGLFGLRYHTRVRHANFGTVGLAPKLLSGPEQQYVVWRRIATPVGGVELVFYESGSAGEAPV